MIAVGAGLFFGMLALAATVVIEGGSFASLIAPSPIILVVFGAGGATLIGFEMSDAKQIPKVLMVAIKGKIPDAGALITTFGRLADMARKEGTLALEPEIATAPDPFMRTGLQLVVDGVDGDHVREVLETELHSVKERHHVGIKFFAAWGGFAPTFGLMGTVLGLTGVLRHLSDPEHLGRGMALGLLGMLYGVASANLVLMPLSARLERLHQMEMEVRELTLEGILALREGSSSRLLVERLEARLSPSQRRGHQGRRTETGGADGAKEAA